MTTLKIKTHDDEVFYEEVSDFNPEELNAKINDNQVLTVVIGNRIISRIKIAEISVEK